MGRNETPASERIHIGFFGRRNAGKSSVMNAVTGQNLAVVSEVKGTTTDPVYKTMELLPLGPVVMIDTPGIDDEGELGELRVKKSRQVLNKTDLAVLVVDGCEGMKEEDCRMTELFRKKQIPYVVVFNKADLVRESPAQEEGRTDAASQTWRMPQPGKTSQPAPAVQPGKTSQPTPAVQPGKTSQPTPAVQPGKISQPVPTGRPAENRLWVSAANRTGIEELKNLLGSMIPHSQERDLLEGLVNPGDLVILVTPIDKAAPKGRLILPQQQTIRALLDHGCMAVTVRETELEAALKTLGKKPELVITDSQAFGKVSAMVPKEIRLTSFSILFARYKGNLAQAVEGVCGLDKIQDKDAILIAEGCTHHRQCGDIGTVKLPAWIRQYTGKEPEFSFTSGTEFPEDLSPYRLVVHCGGCMLNEKEMEYRQACARQQNIPMTNYGILIAHVHGILRRSLEPFPHICSLLDAGKET